MRAPKLCGTPTCSTRVVGRTYCRSCERDRRTREGRGYGSTRQSRREREEVLRRWPRCYLAYPGCTGASAEDDHVVPRHLGGGHELSNRRGACSHCHGIKSRREAAAARRRAQGGGPGASPRVV